MLSAAVNREASRNVTRKASQMVDKASLAQRCASATIDSGDDFSHQSTQAKDDYDINVTKIYYHKWGDDGGDLLSLSMLYSLNL